MKRTRAYVETDGVFLEFGAEHVPHCPRTIEEEAEDAQTQASVLSAREVTADVEHAYDHVIAVLGATVDVCFEYVGHLSINACVIYCRLKIVDGEAREIAATSARAYLSSLGYTLLHPRFE